MEQSRDKRMEYKHNLYVMRHFGTKENSNGVFMGQRDCAINTNAVFNVKIPDSFTYNKKIKLFCSPLRRAVQSASILMKNYPFIDWDLEVMDFLKERSLGEFEGKYKCLLNGNREYFDEMKRLDLKTTPPGGESFDEFRSRVLQVIPVIECALIENDVLLVTHLQVIRTIETYYFDRDLSQWYSMFYSMGEIVRLDNEKS
mgnify:FL=1